MKKPILTKKTYKLPDMFLLMFKVSPFYSIFFIVQRIINALVPTALIFVTAKFINTALGILNGTFEKKAIIIPIILLAAIMVYNIMVNILIEFVTSRSQIYGRSILMPELVKRLASLKYRYLEDQAAADLIKRVSKDFHINIYEMFGRILDFLEYAVFLAGITITVCTQVWWVAVLIFIASVPATYFAVKAGKKSYEAQRIMSKIDRRSEYTSDILKSREAADERTLYGYTDKLNMVYFKTFRVAVDHCARLYRNNFIKSKSGGVFCMAVSTLTMIALLKPVADGDINFGMFIALMGGVFGLAGKLSWGLNWMVQDITGKLEYLKDLTEFMGLDVYEGATDMPEKGMIFKTIEFKNVSFKYPGTDKLILDGVSFVIEKGKHYSFVGVNGAGKTTIIKLLTGLYDNYEGEIIIDGKSLRLFTAAQVKGLSCVVYQDFARYSISMLDNIIIADKEADKEADKKADKEASKEAGKESEKEAALEAARLAGLTDCIEKLPEGIDTYLGKVYENGVDISGGEWQRVAIARSIIDPAPLRILDEPTAALDPIGECMVYEQFEQISRGMTTIFISHRLGSTKLADIIYVISGGKIAESGSHRELMKQEGMYAEMYNAQAQWYNTKNEKAALI